LLAFGSQVREGKRLCSKLDVPFLGDVWDQPPAPNENRLLLHVARFLSQKLNTVCGFYSTPSQPLPDSSVVVATPEYKGFRFNLRFMASYPNLLFAANIFALLYFFFWLIFR
jgi:hypothetical protein